MATKAFKTYHSRLAKEGILKALICGLIVGFSVLIVSAAVVWFTGYDKFWVCLIIFAAVTAASVPLFYKFKFRPTVKAIAQRVDELGLEERILTMTELEGDESYIAMKQREDALAALKTVNAARIKIAVSVPLVVALSIVGVFGTGMTTVSALSGNGTIKSGMELIESTNEVQTKQYEITYTVKGEGEIDGLQVQVIFEGEVTEPVMAIPMEGWAFVQWSDGVKSPYRQEIDITKNLTLTAIFAELQEGDGDEEGDGEGEDDASDRPGRPGDGKGNKPSNRPGGDEGGGKWEAGNQVVDGETPLGDVYDGALSDAVEGTNQNGDISDGEGEIVGDYFDNIGG